MEIDNGLATLASALSWLHGSMNRFPRLLDLKAPKSVLLNERKTWDIKMAEVRHILGDEGLRLPSTWDDAWRSIQVSYETLPGLDELSSMGEDKENA